MTSLLYRACNSCIKLFSSSSDKVAKSSVLPPAIITCQSLHTAYRESLRKTKIIIKLQQKLKWQNHTTISWWLGRSVVRALNSRSRGHGFEFWPVCCQVTTCLCRFKWLKYQTYIFQVAVWISPWVICIRSTQLVKWKISSSLVA